VWEPSHTEIVLATIIDIARESGVSKSTVSRVISKDGYVSEEAKSRVLDAMKKLDYTPNFIARGMRTNRSDTIGFFVPDYSNPFYTELYKGIESVARKEGYVSLVCHTGEDSETELHYIQELLKRKVDGVIFCTYNRTKESTAYLTELSRKLPIVFMDPVFNDLGFSSVTSDGRAGIKLAVEHACSLGCKKIAYISGPQIHEVTKERLNGYLDGLNFCGCFHDKSLVYSGNFSLESGGEAAKYFLSLQNVPDAILAATDVMAIGALKELRTRGVNVPEDIKVIGFDNIPLCELVDPPLTTVSQPIAELGISAAEILLNKIRTPDSPNKQIAMQCTLIKRKSS
jgi:DNA-binding LacI/PurR family transcriptional regulator